MVQVSCSELIEAAWASDYIGVDTEGTNIKTTDLRDGTGYAYGVGVACRPKGERQIYSAYFPIAHTRDNLNETLISSCRTLVETHARVIMHNSKHDIPALQTMQITRTKKFYCTLQMIHWLDQDMAWRGGYSLDNCAKFFLKDEGKKKSDVFNAYLDLFGWHPDFPQKEMGIYCCYDAELALRLFEFHYRNFKRQGFDG